MDKERRPRSFYVLGACFAVFVLFLYGPLSAIILLSFQGPSGGLTFPMNGVSMHWFTALFAQQRVGDFWGASHLDATVRLAHHVRRFQPVQSCVRGGGA